MTMNVVGEKETHKKTVGGCPECLINSDRRAVLVPESGPRNVFVDDPDVISKKLCLVVGEKVVAAKFEFHIPTTQYFKSKGRGHGQAGVIRQTKLAGSPGSFEQVHYSCFMVTAKHNLRKITEEDDPNHGACIVEASMRVLGGAEIVPIFNVQNWEKQPQNKILLRKTTMRVLEWDCGIDLAVARRFNDKIAGFTDEDQTFELVRSDFVYTRGQHVGIAVFFEEDAKPTPKTAAHNKNKPLEMSQDDLDKIYGLPGHPNIYTGKITFVAESHIEYDMNSFTGCSGAVVFLLDRGQPADGSVQEQDYGKAIAVHTGCVPQTPNRNFGFKLTQAMLDASEEDPPVVDFEEKFGPGLVG